MNKCKIISILKSPFTKLFICFAFMVLFFGINSAKAQLTFNNTLTALQLAQTLAGPGITVTNATFTCPTNGIGSFAGGGTTNIGIASGIILTTGPNTIASGPNNNGGAGVCASGTYPGDPASGDPDLTSLLSGVATFDACKLEFDMIPLCDTLKFNYVFASEEYPEYVCSTYNDAFAFFISGPGIVGQQNIALIPNTTIAVAINSVNSGSAGSSSGGGTCTSLGYSQYYVDNIGGSTIQYDGFTTALTAKSVVQSCQTYHLKITIADAGDCIFDSGLLLKAGSLQCQPVKSITAIQNGIEGCQNGSFKFCRDDSSTALTFNYTIAGTATNGTDFNTISNSIIIPAGQSCISLPIVPVADGISEPGETIMLIYQPGACPTMDTAFITITDSPPLNAGPDATICSGGNATIGIPAVTGTTYSWTPITGLSSSTISNPSVTLTNIGTSPATTNYILSATKNGCVSYDTVKVIVNPMPTVNAGPDQVLCASWVQLNGIIGGGATSGTWGGGTGIFNPTNSSLNNVYTPSYAEIDAGTITLTLTTNNPPGPCPSASDQIVILISPQSIVAAGPDQLICIGNTITLAGSIIGPSTIGIWSGGAGTYNPDSSNPTAIYTPSAAEETAGTVTLTYTTNDPNGSCTPVSDQMVITINHMPTANAGSGLYVCSGSNITLAGSIGGSATSGLWSGGTGTYSPDNTALNAVYTPSAAEYAADSVILTLSTNDPAGPCTFSSSNVIFHFYEIPVVNFSADSSSGCPVHCTDFINSTTIGGGGVIASWNWDFGDGSSGSTLENPFNCFPLSGFYDIKLTATSTNGCVSFLTQTHLVHVFDVPNAEFNPTPNKATILDPTITLNNLSSSDVNYWHWDFGDGDSLAPGTSSPVHIYPGETAGNYIATLIVHNTDGCYDTISHEIIIEPGFTFFIPNSFSPNGDEHNDYFFGSGIGILKYDLWIFDRWGNMIFHGKELNEKWNGKANNGENTAEIDVYIWKVQITDVLNKFHSFIGTVTIVK